jgi:hypothetical protein
MSNNGPAGQPIWGSQDDGLVKAGKGMMYALKAVAPIINIVSEESGFSTPEGKKLLEKELGKVFGWIASSFITSYTRKPEARRDAYKINKMKNTMKYETKSAIRHGKQPPIETWLKNMKRRINKIIEE